MRTLHGHDRGDTAEPAPGDPAADRAAIWLDARRALSGLPHGQGLNIAHEAVDRHALGPLADRAALRVLRRGGDTRDVTYRELREITNRFANVLRRLGVSAGERVFTLLGRGFETHVVALGALKNRCVYAPLFAAFGPEPIRQRLALGDARVLVTTTSLYQRKVERLRSALPQLEHVLLIRDDDDNDDEALPIGTRDLGLLLEGASPDFSIPPTDPEDVALLHFTSGTTGTPKGALHVHDAVVAHAATARHVLDLRSDDVFWCTADPGWVTGVSYGVIAPLVLGVTSIIDEGEFDADRWYRQLADHRVTVWYTAPTAVRMLMRAGSGPALRADLHRLRLIASVGEALAPDAVHWSLDVLGIPIRDNWWQTETGAIMIANDPALEIRPGSMGRPVPGVTATVLTRGAPRRPAATGEVGELALRPGWPSMFRGYLGDHERYARCFADGWYLSGDLAMRDADGYFWFVGRSDDVIKSAGHLIGPFEVEAALLAHPAVVEAAAIGRPDPTAGEIVIAFVTLHDGYEPTDQLSRELLGFGRKQLGAIAPREIRFAEQLPHTGSGKVMRRLLKARELGIPEGDLSTLEPA